MFFVGIAIVIVSTLVGLGVLFVRDSRAADGPQSSAGGTEAPK